MMPRLDWVSSNKHRYTTTLDEWGVRHPNHGTLAGMVKEKEVGKLWKAGKR